MRVSLNTIKQFIDFELPPVDELVKHINEQLGGVEEVIRLGDVYKDAVIVKVVECEKHPGADRLNVTKVDDGGVVADIPRDDKGLVQVVCGAPNVHSDMFAVWLPPKSTVPASANDEEPFVLGARELRGVLSQGMLAAGDELAINGDHDGIIEIDAQEWIPSGQEIKPGANFAKVFGLDDTIIDIENKMFTHRPDLFGQIGVAREIAGILGHAFTSPDWYANSPVFTKPEAEALPLEVFNDASQNVPRFMAVAMQNVAIKPSPLWLQIELMRLGSKSINNIVDVTNYVMLLTAQPTHAYDYDKLRGHKLGARMAKPGETVTLLNHKTYELTQNDIVIADAEGPVGLAGIMGGGDSEVDQNTKNIVLEVASFDMYTLRKSSMRYGVFTDAVTRFNKGQSPLQNDKIINLLMMSIKDVSSAEQASSVFDMATIDLGKNRSYETDTSFVNDRLGLSLSLEEMSTLLYNVEIGTMGNVTITPPFWRTDLEQPEDIVEEVGRLYGFDKLPRELPLRSMKAAPLNTSRAMRHQIREMLSRAGANEVLTYSFVHEDLMKKVGQHQEHAYQLSNALSPDLQFYRLSLTPSLLAHVHMDVRAGYDRFALFEIGKTHFKDEMDTEEPDVPNEDMQIALVIAYGDKYQPTGAPYYHALQMLREIAEIDETALQPLKDFDLSSDQWGAELVAPYEPNRSAVIVRDGQIWGVVGEFTSQVRKTLKLPAFSAGFEIHLDLIRAKETKYKPLSKYPSITQDLSLKVAVDTSYQAVLSVIESSADESKLDIAISPVAVYQSEHEANSKTITFRLRVTSFEKTLREEEVSRLVRDAATRAHDSLGAVVI